MMDIFIFPARFVFLLFNRQKVFSDKLMEV